MTVEGHAELHERAVRNLIENALTHTPPGTEVEVIVGPGREIKVRDHGAGIPVKLREAVFEDFFLARQSAAERCKVPEGAWLVRLGERGFSLRGSRCRRSSRKPSSATVHRSGGPNAGVTVVWNGGNTVVVHRGTGLIALFKKTFSLHDPRVTTIRQSLIDQLSFAAILAHAQSTPGIVGPSILDIPTEAVTLVRTSFLDGTGMTREVVYISVPTGVPLRILGYEGNTLVRQIDFSNIILRP